MEGCVWIVVVSGDKQPFQSGHLSRTAPCATGRARVVPRCASALKPEDPRHAMMMAHPPRKPDCRAELRTFVYQSPKVGDVLLWESFIRHEVPLNMAEEERISVSSNYR
ncbi:MAG: TIGR02466 family protein [Epibacterium sp.]|nr:TIGR02466 family protein [Epibacterium sp.]